ncbi:YdgA family protein [Rodentibacter trehalosifermentans]|uniref:GTP-binding protein n=1 Tax=Rodentibacter trehalosifermentans TaxID=1908263 RepID=A0A1V3ILJ8_9PAST|nr:DUF945 family protein [Rodentibacter trehalosifermentans]OOF42487.1 hypothetical protein BKK51_12820 [Rodentibacter trehalosifermentans]OOF47444.1 hypothetical protein BKK53_11300 [Rodentibacter trehalosifermentans]
MKKSKIAMGVIAVLGAAWLGGTWFTAQKAETEYHRQIELANQQFQRAGLSDSFKVEYKNKQFDRGFFSSQIEDELILSFAGEEKQWIIPFSSKLYHGPLPLNQLAKFHLMPAMFALEGAVGKNDTTQPLFDVIKSDKPIQYQATTGYGLTTYGTLKVLGGELVQSGKNKMAWSDVTMDLEVNKDFSGSYSLSADKLISDYAIGADTGNFDDSNIFESGKIELKGMKSSSNIAPTKWAYLYTGKGNASIESMAMTTLHKDGTVSSVVEKGIKGTSEVTLDGDFISVKSTNNMESLLVDDKDLGKFSYNLEFNHLEANAVNALFESIVTVFKEKKSGDFMAINQIIDVWAKQHGMTIFNNQPQFKFNPISISDNQGKVSFDMNIALAKDPKFDLMRGSLYKQFTDFSVDIQVDKATAENILTKFAPEEDKANIKAKIEEMAEEAAGKGIAVNNEKSVTMKLVLKNGELKLNGQVVPEEQAQGVIFMLLMSAAMAH